ncbi:MAG: sodium:solute symporter [Hyphomicrobiales bacterium]|nr:sodium:solute symporter [Hyphomicrobiales bacterium]
MSNVHFVTNEALGPAGGLAVEILVGVALLALVYYVKVNLVRSTKDFIIANRKIGFGFGVAGLISIWTWAMAVMMSAAQTYTWGLSGLFWFTVPNGLAVIAVIPFVRQIRSMMPNGYTIPEFVRARYDGNVVAGGVVVLGALFGSLIEVIINIKGTSLVISNVFGTDARLAAIIGLAVVLAYSILGGLWASFTTAALSTLLHTVPSAIVVVVALHYAGGVDAVWHAVNDQGNALLSVTRPDAAMGFGITLALGLLTAAIAGQEFWQAAWALKKKDVSRTFLWAGAWFYPIPICLGLLGLVGLALHVDLNTQLTGDAAAVGPFLVSHLGLPTWLVILYVVVILTACYAVIDSAFTATSSVFVVDIIRPLVPQIHEKTLFVVAKAPMFLAAIVAAGVVLSGVDFVTIVLTTYAIRTAILLPLILSIFWSRMTGWGFVGGVVLAIAIGMPIRSAAGDLWGSLSILAISALVPLAIGLANQRSRFDFDRLRRVEDATAVPAE